MTAAPHVSRRAVLGSLAAAFVPLGAARAQDSRAQTQDGFRILEARPGAAKFAGGRESPVWTYDGATPGPVLRVKQGEEARFRLVNKLPEATTLHWHGLRNENAMDGVAGLTQPAVAPGASFDYRFKAADSGLLLYRPAGVGAEQAARGLGGLLIVDEAQPLAVDRDFALVLQDWTPTPQDAAASAAPGPAGRLGAELTANGAPAPLRETFAPGARLRLRVANACASRIAILIFSGATPYVMAIDGQACDRFEPVRNLLPIAPGARFDLLLDLPTAADSAATLVLKERAADPGGAELAVFKTAGAPATGRGPIASLPYNSTLPAEIRLAEAKKLQLKLAPPGKPGGAWTINGAPGGYKSKPLASVRRGAPMSILFDNAAPAALAMHVHGVSMRLLHDLDDGWEPYWRNAVIVPPQRRKIVALKFETPGKWAVRSDIADQEAAGLCGWIEVT